MSQKGIIQVRVMNAIIYYFSGTGNSLNAARIIAGQIGGARLISAREGTEIVSAEDADLVGFVCPVYEWDIPSTMKDYAEKIRMNPNAYVFMVATYILVHGRAFETMEKILEKKGSRLHYSKAIRCVASQCIAYPPFPPEKIMIPYSRRKAIAAGKKIAERAENKYPKMSGVIRRLYPKLMTPFMEIQQEYDKGFYTSEKCTGCGICRKVCPCRNITIENKRPVYNHRCIGCNACVVYCPRKAIQFRTPEAYQKLDNVISNHLKLPERRKRYHHPEVSARDLMSSQEEVRGI